jgi:membrane protein required for colicin V production
MGLDLVLGVIIIIAAFRGWFRGFVSQAVHLGALVAAVYAAVHVRDYAKPYVTPSLASIQPDLVDRLLWWVSAVATYLILVGFALLIVKMTRRPEIPGISQSGRNDQFAGFFLGGLKGLLVAAFLAAGIQNYAMDQVKNVSWADEQVKASWALKWNESYQPARRIWASRPVRHFVGYIHRMGLQRPGDVSDSRSGDDLDQEEVVRTASRSGQADANGRDRSTSESAPRPDGSPSSSPPAAEAGETAADNPGNLPKVVEKPAADNAN